MAGFRPYRQPEPLPPYKDIQKKKIPASTFCPCRPSHGNPTYYDIDPHSQTNDPMEIAIVAEVIRNMGKAKTKPVPKPAPAVNSGGMHTSLRPSNTYGPLDLSHGIQQPMWSYPSNTMEGMLPQYVSRHFGQNAYATGLPKLDARQGGGKVAKRSSAGTANKNVPYLWPRGPFLPAPMAMRPGDHFKGVYQNSTSNYGGTDPRFSRCPCPKCSPQVSAHSGYPFSVPVPMTWKNQYMRQQLPLMQYNNQHYFANMHGFCECGCGAPVRKTLPQTLLHATTSKSPKTYLNSNAYNRSPVTESLFTQGVGAEGPVMSPIDFGMMVREFGLQDDVLLPMTNEFKDRSMLTFPETGSLVSSNRRSVTGI